VSNRDGKRKRRRRETEISREEQRREKERYGSLSKEVRKERTPDLLAEHPCQ